MRVLVTGSSGRLGPYVVRELERAGHELVLFSRRPPDSALSHLPWLQGDIASSEDCLRAVEGGFDAIQHLAAQAWPTDHPGQRELAEEQGLAFDTTMRSNVLGTYYLLQAALTKSIEIFVMTGSNCAVGHGYRVSDTPFPFRYLPVDENHPSAVEDTYSYSKLAGELLLASYTRAYGMRTYAVRAAGICDAERRLGMARSAKPAQGWNPWLWAWVGSEDVASAHRLLMERAHDIPAHGAYLCNSDDTAALEPTRELIERFRPELLPVAGEMEGHQALLSSKLLQQVVGWQPRTSWRVHLEEGSDSL